MPYIYMEKHGEARWRTVTGSMRVRSAKVLILTGIVALKRMVWRCPLKYEKMVRMSSSNPRSIIRSASSRQKYRQQSKLSRPLLSRSMSRPGVATAMWTPGEAACEVVHVDATHAQRSACSPVYANIVEYWEMFKTNNGISATNISQYSTIFAWHEESTWEVKRNYPTK